MRFFVDLPVFGAPATIISIGNDSAPEGSDSAAAPILTSCANCDERMPAGLPGEACRSRWNSLGLITLSLPIAPAANPEQSFIRTGYSEQQEGSTAVLMAERALGDAQGRHAIARTPRARIGQLSTWSLGCGFDSGACEPAGPNGRVRCTVASPSVEACEPAHKLRGVVEGLEHW